MVVEYCFAQPRGELKAYFALARTFVWRYTMGMEREDIGAAIKEERIRQGIGRTALGREVGCKESAIRRIEEGSCPSTAFADRLLRALGVKLTIGHTSGRKKLDMGGAA